MTTMGSNLPGWLTPVAWAFIALAAAAALAIAYDIFGRGHRHAHLSTDLVWVGSALYLGPFALAFYARRGRAPVTPGRSADRPGGTPGRPTVADGLPGGTASAVAHVIGVPLVVLSGLTIAGTDLWVMILVIGVLAIALLFVHERAAGASTGARVTAGAAALAAVLTVVAFDVGMGGWMVLLHFNALMPAATEASFWFLMQVGIVLGLVTGYPAVAWLARHRYGAASRTA